MKRPTHLATRDAESDLIFRAVTLNRAGLNEEARTVPAVLSTEHPAQRYFGNEILDHTSESVDLKRAANGLPLLFGHDFQSPIGRVRNVRLEGRTLLGELYFSKSAQGQEVFEQVIEGVLTDVSIGYRVKKWLDYDESNTRTAIGWEIFETSVVSVAEDPDAGMDRRDLDTDPKPKPGPELESRAAQLAEIFKPVAATHGELLSRCLLDTSITVDQARDMIIQALTTDMRTMPSGPGTAYPNGDDAADKFEKAVDEWAAVKWRQVPDLSARGAGQKVLDLDLQDVADGFTARYRAARDARGQNPYIGLNALDLFRRYMIDVMGSNMAATMSRDTLARELLTRAGGVAGHGPTDFTNLLANNIGKSLQVSYVEAPETYQAL